MQENPHDARWPASRPCCGQDRRRYIPVRKHPLARSLASPVPTPNVLFVTDLLPDPRTGVSLWRQHWATLLVFVIAVAVYLNALRNGYAMDDVPLVQNNRYVHGFSHLREVLLGPYWPSPAALYRPLVLLSFAVEWTLFGDNPTVFHAVNIVLHGLVTASLYLLLVRLGAARWVAIAGAALFAVHPVHVEAVANIVGRAELFAAFFFLLACHLHLTRSLAPPIRIMGTAACYFLALGGKEISVTLPAVLLLLDAFRDRAGRLATLKFVRENAGLYLTLTIVLAGYMALRIQAIGEATGAGVAAYLVSIPTSERVATAVRIWPEFARLLFWPEQLAAEWGPAVISPATWTHPLVWVGLLLGAAATVLVVAAWNRQRWVSLAILWFAIVILPVSQLFFPVGVILAERTLYLPSMAVAMLLPAIAAWLSEQGRQKRVAMLALFGVVFVLAVHRTWRRTPAWESNSAVAQALITEHPSSFRAMWMGAGMMASQGRNAEAIALLKEAVELTERRLYPLNMDLARTQLSAGQPGEAEPIIRHTIRLFPRGALAYLYLSDGFLQKGQYDDAVRVLRQGYFTAYDTAYNRATFRHNLSLAHDGAGSPDSALVWRRRSMDPELGNPVFQEWYHLARLRSLLGQQLAAEQALDSARASAPEAVRDSLMLHPLPEPNSRFLRGWRLDALP